MDYTHQLLTDFLDFVKVFFRSMHSKDFIISEPVSARSHVYDVVKVLYDVFLLKQKRVIINIPPGWSKSELVKMFICWTTAQYPDARHIYISYSHELAAAHTADIKRIMQSHMYETLFDIRISRDTRAKDFFMTDKGGAVAAFGSSGAITGRDAGLPGLDRYTGAVIADDLIKPDEAHSDTIRERVRRNFFETIVPRCRGINVPIVIIGQRLHEDDICATLLNEYPDEWQLVEIEALDRAGHSRYPEQISTEQLHRMKEKQSYVFWSQYQQKPIPSGGALYKSTDFIKLDKMPDIYATFVTCDTAETEKTWNDKTVFSFWGLYKAKFNGIESDQTCIHWLDCWELSIEPADLEEKFLEFWANSMKFKIKPTTALIEKKSTGVTLVSMLKRTPGIRAIAIERTKVSGSKTQRFIDMQYYIASRLITLPEYGKHTEMCIEHMLKITANNAHRFDDIADTCYDAIKASLIDKIIVSSEQDIVEYNNIAARMVGFTNKVDELRRKAHGSSQNSPRTTFSH